LICEKIPVPVSWAVQRRIMILVGIAYPTYLYQVLREILSDGLSITDAQS
jgi:hypothetical protein